MVKPPCTECGERPIVCRAKCRRCYNRTFYNPGKRRAYYFENRDRDRELRRSRYRNNRAVHLAKCKAYRDARKITRPSAPKSVTYNELVRVPVKGWGCVV